MLSILFKILVADGDQLPAANFTLVNNLPELIWDIIQFTETISDLRNKYTLRMTKE